MLQLFVRDYEMKDVEIYIECEQWADVAERDLSRDFANVQISMPDGRKYALNVWTYDFFPDAISEDASEFPDNKCHYLLPPDLFVESLDRATIEQAVEWLIAKDDLSDSWLVHNGESE